MRIQVPVNIRIEEIEALVKEGAKFIAYQYIISMPLFPPNKRISRLFYIAPNEKSSKYCLKYNLMNCLLGFWGLPFGPPAMATAIISNLRGGINLTDDVMVNLKQDTFNKKEIDLVKPSRIFISPSKSNLKEFEKVLKSLKKDIVIKEPVVVGYFINTEDNENAYHVIGLPLELSNERIQIIRGHLYKRFYKHTKFEIVSIIDNDYEHVERLRSEGVKVDTDKL